MVRRVVAIKRPIQIHEMQRPRPQPRKLRRPLSRRPIHRHRLAPPLLKSHHLTIQQIHRRINHKPAPRRQRRRHVRFHRFSPP